MSYNWFQPLGLYSAEVLVAQNESIFSPDTYSLQAIRFLQNDKSLGEQYTGIERKNHFTD